jgi:hypothetical protein
MDDDLRASERAMQMICAVVTSSRPPQERLDRIDAVVRAWVFYPARLTPTAMIEDL